VVRLSAVAPLDRLSIGPPLSSGDISASDFKAPSNSNGGASVVYSTSFKLSIERLIPFHELPRSTASDSAGLPSLPMSSVTGDPIQEHMEAFGRRLVERLDEGRSQDWSVAADGIMVFVRDTVLWEKF
jgi:hypothetical protein